MATPTGRTPRYRAARASGPTTRADTASAAAAATTDTAATTPGAGPDIVRSSAVMAGGTALSRITGLVRVGALTFALGRTALADAFNLANIAPNLIYELALGGVLSASLVPLFTAANDRRELADDDARDDGVSAIFTAAFVALVTITVIAIALVTLFSGPISGLLKPTTGASPEVRRAAVTSLAQLALPQILLYGLTTLCTAVLNARRRFGWAAYAPVLNNVVSSAAFIAVGVRLGGRPAATTALGIADTPTLIILGLGSTLGVAAMAFALFGPVGDAEPDLRWHFEPRHHDVRRLISLSGWTIGYVVANQIALLVVYLTAGHAATGTLTAYTTAFIFFQLPHGLFAVSLMTTTQPELATAANRGDLAGFQRRWLQGLRLIWMVIVPAAVGYTLIARPLMSVLLERGRFGSADAAVTGRTLAAFAVGLPAFSVYLYVLRAFYSGQDTRTPFFINVFQNACNIGFLVALGSSSPARLAMAYSLSYAVAAVVSVVALVRRLGSLGPETGETLLAMVRVVGASALMAVAVWVIARRVGDNDGGGAVLRTVVAVLVGGGVYAAAATLLHIEGTDRLVAMARRVIPGRH